MTQADIGVNVFLIDSFTSPMGLINGAMAIFASTLISTMSAQNAAGDAMAALTTRYNEQQAALAELMLDEDMYNAQLAANLITQDEYDIAMADNAVAQQVMMEKIDATTASLDAQGVAFQDAGLSATEMGAALGGGVMLIAFGGALLDATKQAGSLQDELAKLSVAGNLSAADMNRLSGFLYDLAGNSMFAATDVAQGFTIMMGKGADATDIMNHLGQAMVDLAEATGQDGTAGAAQLLASTLQMFQLPASQAKQVVDELTYAFYNGLPDINGLTQGLKNVGGMAHSLNVPFSEVITMLDALGRAGMSGSQAGTALRYMIQSMYEPTQKQANELEYLGIITANKVTPAFAALDAQLEHNTKNLPAFDGTVNSLYEIFKAGQKAGSIDHAASFLQWADAVGMLRNKFYDANGRQIDFMHSFGILVESIRAHSKAPQAFADSMAQMFNVRSGQGFADIVDQLGGLSDQQKKLIKSTFNMGLAHEDAQKRMSTMPSQLTALGTTFQHFMGIVGMPFAQKIQDIASSINGFLTGIIDKHPGLMKIIGVVLAIGAAGGAIVLIAGIITLLAAAIGAISGPILLVVAAVALIAVGIGFLVHWIQTSKPAMQGFHNLMNIIGGVAKMVAAFFMSQMKPAIAQLQDAWKQLWTAIQPLLPALEMVGKVLLALVGGIILAIVLGAIISLRIAIWVLSQVFYGIAASIQHAGNFFSWIGGLAHMVAGAIQTSWSTVQSFFEHLPGNINRIFLSLVNDALGFGKNLIHMFAQGIMSGVGIVKNAVGTVANTVKSFLGFHSPTEEGPGSDADTWSPNLMRMMTVGIVSGSPQLAAAAHGAALGIRGAFTSPAINSSQGLFAGQSGTSLNGNTTVNLNMDGKTVGQVVIDRITGQLKMSGSGRLLR